MATTIVTTLAPLFRTGVLGVAALWLRAGAAVIRTAGTIPSVERWAPNPTLAAWERAKQLWVSSPTTTEVVAPLLRSWLWEVRRLRREGSVWAPAAMRHPRDVRGPSLFASDLDEFALGSLVDVLLGALLLCCVLVVIHNMYPPGDLGLWDTTPRVIPGTRVIPSRNPTSPSEAWILRACGGVVPITSVFRRRLRRRARWVRCVEAVLGTRYGTLGQLVKGKWVPDHIPPGAPREVAWLLGSVTGGVRLLGGGCIAGEPSQPQRLSTCGTCRLKVDADCSCPVPDRLVPGEEQLYLVVEIRGEISVVFPALLAKLRLYALCRERNSQLLGALRTRAVEWCKSVSLDPVSSDLAVTGAVGLAMQRSTLEAITQSQVESAMAETPFRHALA
jgi:hypothetical protein